MGELYRASFAAPDKVETLLSSEGDIAPYGWTRDGKSVVYWRAPELSASIWADGVALYSIPASGGPERKLGVSALKHRDVLSLAPESHGNWLAATNSEDRETWSGQRTTTGRPRHGRVARPDAARSRRALPGMVARRPKHRLFCGARRRRGLPEGKGGANITVVNPAGTRQVKVAPASNSRDRRRRTGAPLSSTTQDLDSRSGGRESPAPAHRGPEYRDESPLWSADGSHLLFGRMDYDGHASLWLM